MDVALFLFRSSGLIYIVKADNVYSQNWLLLEEKTTVKRQGGFASAHGAV